MSASELQPSGGWATAWRTARFNLQRWAIARVGFWRALIDVTLLGHALTLFAYLLYWFASGTLFDLLSFVSLGVYIWGAWRLEPGLGGLLRRSARILLWAILLSLISGVLAWLFLEFVPLPQGFLGIRAEDMRLPLAAVLINSAFLIFGLFVPTRLLIVLWAEGLKRLCWQLTFSSLLIGTLTSLFVPVALFFYIAVLSLAVEPILIEPNIIATEVATALEPIVQRGVSPGQLTPLLEGLLEGSARLPLPTDTLIADTFSDLPNSGVQRLTLLLPDGVVLASAGSEPFEVENGLPDPVAVEMQLVLDQVRDGDCANGRPVEGLIADSAACPIRDQQGNPLAVLLVESNLNSRAQVEVAWWRIMRVTLIGTSLTLNLAVIVILAILPISFGLGYLLARRLTRRIERLAAATDSIAAGNLARRVDVDSADEIGRLAADFNTMAVRLAEREQALADAAARSERLLKTNQRLVADVSHELRNPLATLRGYLEALEQEHGDKLPARDMAIIQGEMRRLTALIEDLFTLARAEARQLPLTIEAVDAAVLVRDMVETLAPLARREREIEVVAALPADLPLVSTDRMRLEQVLLNLAQNAFRHTPPGGIIAFEAQARDGVVVLAVADTGIGIPPEDLDLVFERFYRGDSSRARETGGAGLGLALVRELVTSMGGSVTAESVVGRGSRFAVTLRRSE